MKSKFREIQGFVQVGNQRQKTSNPIVIHMYKAFFYPT